MKYEKIISGKFISRPNRFVAHVLVDGKVQIAHVKNTGRCKELLQEGATVYLEDFSGRMGSRKLQYSLIAVRKGNLLINMDSQAPNKVCEEWLLQERTVLPDMGQLTVIQREKTYGNSRFDFYLEDIDGKKAYLEVKGVTLEESGVAMFPDAPTERGVKHVKELCVAKKDGYESYILFVIQMDGMTCFMPNSMTHKAFANALVEAKKQGVHILAYDCIVEPDTLKINNKIVVELG